MGRMSGGLPGSGRGPGGGPPGGAPNPDHLSNQAPSSRERYRQFRKDKVWLRSRPFGEEETDGAPRADATERRRYLGEYYRLIRPHLRTVIGLILLGALAGAFAMVHPYVFGRIVGEVLPGDAYNRDEKLQWLLIGCGAMLVAVLCARALHAIRNIRTIALNHKMIVRLRRRLYRHLLQLPLSELYEMKTGTLVSRVSGDVDKATSLLQMAVMSPAAALFEVIFVTLILFAWNWKLALAAWIVLPPMMFMSFMWVVRIRPIFRSAGRDRNIIDGRATETFSGIRVVRSFRREPRERSDYTVADNTMIRKLLFGMYSAMALDAVWQVILPLSAIFIVVAGGLLYIWDYAQLDQIIAFQIYTGQLLFPIFRIVSSLNQTQESMAALERVFEVFGKKVDKPDAPDALEAPRHVDRLEFDHVWFEYQPGRPVIRDFHLDVPGGSMVAFVGPSGAGKTTMTDLIARFYDPTGGVIRLNGIDVQDLKIAGYRALLAVVQQEVFLFDGSVHQNIAYGRRDATRAQVIDAAERANAHQFIMDLPHGYDTLIGERGVRLSGGQRQRLSIARAILADPQILILDEATSNLDTESERLIQSALNDLYANRTTFAIAHRLSTVTHADIIVVLDNGRIVEVGSHDELMRREGMYYDMVQRQREFAEA